MGRIAENLTGRKFGKWLVIRRSEINNSSNKPQWICVCTNCDSEHLVSSANLKSRNSNQCTKCALFLDPGEASLNKLMTVYKWNAKTRKIPFALSREEFRFFTSQNCEYCGRVPNTIKKYHTGNGDYPHNGIDRVDNTLGYIVNNCVTCCGICNRAKSALSKEEFLTWIDSVYRHSIKPCLVCDPAVESL